MPDKKLRCFGLGRKFLSDTGLLTLRSSCSVNIFGWELTSKKRNSHDTCTLHILITPYTIISIFMGDTTGRGRSTGSMSTSYACSP